MGTSHYELLLKIENRGHYVGCVKYREQKIGPPSFTVICLSGGYMYMYILREACQVANPTGLPRQAGHTSTCTHVRMQCLLSVCCELTIEINPIHPIGNSIKKQKLCTLK